VEQDFRDLKDVIDMRPIFHKTDERIEAHIFVASLAFPQADITISVSFKACHPEKPHPMGIRDSELMKSMNR